MFKVIIIIIFFIGFAFASEPEDTAKTKQKEKFNKTLTKKTDPSIKQRRERRDFFIDKDGDGICDNRAKGMSFERQRKRQGPGSNGHGKGNQGGNK